MSKAKRFHFMLAVLAAVLLSGCGAAMKKPLPATPLTQAERTRFEGAWVGADDKGEGVVYAHVTCDGVAHLAIVGWDKNRFRVDMRLQWLFSRAMHDKHASGFISMRLLEERGKPDKDMPYVPLKYRFLGDDTLVVWAPRLDAVAAAIKAGRLKGRIDTYSNDITSSPKAVLDYLDSPDGARLFDYRQPFVLHKVVRKVADAQDCKKK